MVRYAGVNPVITTIAMLSVLQGIALLLRPTPGGLVNPGFTEFLRIEIGPLPASCFVLIVAAIAGDFWLHRTRSGLRLKAVGFREQAAKRNGVRTNFVHLRAYMLSARAGDRRRLLPVLRSRRRASVDRLDLHADRASLPRCWAARR